MDHSVPFIINLAPTGMVPTKALTPHVPITVEEIVADVGQAFDRGVQMVQVHARTSDGQPSSDPAEYARIITAVRQRCPGIVVCASTSGRTLNTFEARSAVLDLTGNARPDLASLTLSSLNFSQTASVNSPDTVVRLLQRMTERGIRPELEVFDVGMINFSKYLLRKGWLRPPLYYNIILGNIASAQVDACDVAALLHALPAGSTYAFGGLGPEFQLQANTLGLVWAHGVRIGLEDNIWLDPPVSPEARGQLATNSLLVERMVRLASTYGRRLASVGWVRQQLGLAGSDGVLTGPGHHAPSNRCEEDDTEAVAAALDTHRAGVTDQNPASKVL